jgi:hypothetical protein
LARSAKTSDIAASDTGMTDMLHQKGMPPTTRRASLSAWTRRADA